MTALAHRSRLAALVVVAIMAAACVKPTPANIPGAVNNADAQIYVALSDLQAAIIEAQKQQAVYPAIKPIMDNNIGPNYTRARNAAEAYHNALAGGQAPDGTKQASLMKEIQGIMAALSAALKNVGASK